MKAVPLSARILDSTTVLWRRWGTKTVHSIADQGLTSGVNFALNILLIRWLPVEEYGAFAVSYSVMLFVGGMHNSFSLEPLGVFGGAHEGDDLRRFLGISFVVHAGLALALGISLAVAAAVAYYIGAVISGVLAAAALTLPFVLTHWLLRRACYLRMKPRWALAGSTAYAITLLLSLAIVWHSAVLSSATAFLVLIPASIVASALMWRYVGITLHGLGENGEEISFRSVLRQNYVYGRWTAGSSVVHWISSSIYVPLVGAVVGMSEAGILRSMQNLILPIQQVFSALGLLMLPYLSRRAHSQHEGFRKSVSTITGLNVAAAAAYCLVVVLVDDRLVSVLYGGKDYSQYLWLLPFLGIATTIVAGQNMMAIALKAINRPVVDFRAKSMGAIVTLTVGIVAVYANGLYGVVGALILSNVSILIVLLYHWGRKKKPVVG